MEIDIIKMQNVNPANQLVGFLNDVSDLFLEKMENRIRGLLEEYSPKSVQEQDSYLTIGEVCQVLNKTRPTLDNWKKKGILVPDKYLGRSPMYLKSNIINLKK